MEVVGVDQHEPLISEPNHRCWVMFWVRSRRAMTSWLSKRMKCSMHISSGGFTIVSEKYSTYAGYWAKVEAPAFHWGSGATNPHMPQPNPVPTPARKRNKRPAAAEPQEVKSEDPRPKLQPPPAEAPLVPRLWQDRGGARNEGVRQFWSLGAHEMWGATPKSPSTAFATSQKVSFRTIF